MYFGTNFQPIFFTEVSLMDKKWGWNCCPIKDGAARAGEIADN